MNEYAFQPRMAATNQIRRNNLTLSTTSEVAKLENAQSLRIANLDDTITVYINFGDANVVATADDMPMPPGTIEIVSVPAGIEYIALLAASGTPVVHITQGVGL